MKAGDVLHLTRAASPQFVRPILFRLIKIRSDFHTYDGWAWLDGYQLDKNGDAASRRELYVLMAGVKLLHLPSAPRPRALSSLNASLVSRSSTTEPGA
ncbi:hypothetical protein [Micromonospora musae]|uniref:Uncharacterized protein n=1 Tax=Micromonospora musae TaxID=1894970 RepID=A0A3A9YBV1_9ACTN|nr:hypothetical protein [Micromonospora musae]RKN34772.1 hypothetical protein D7044_08185 [Micromonospora musae]